MNGLIFRLALALLVACSAGQVCCAAEPDASPATDSADWMDLSHVPSPQLTGLQFTMMRQKLSSLTSPYASNLSLPSAGDIASTYTYGIYLGWEPISRLQLYLDLEKFQGAAIGNATGLASLTNGDAIRSGSQDLPHEPYIARKFVRYTIALDAPEHEADRSLDQLSGFEADTRLEFKFGTMAVTDDFDRNRYANSTRTQFENWSLFNNTAWDFAADTRGYTNGLMLAYVGPVWSVRYGIYQMPKFANGQPLCAPISRCRGENFEITWVQPKVDGLVIRFLAYRNIYNGGDYREAIAVARANGTTPDIAADDRPGRSKYGLGLNIEQPLADAGETGLFTRLGWNDGRNESFAFTEIDRLFSLGAQVDGLHWWRPADRAGIAYVIGGLSSPHEQYLAAGGQGFVVGDGRLNYGLEQVLEAYYRFEPVRHVQLSVDYQRIKNPGFNQDRGPANVMGFRIHLDY